MANDLETMYSFVATLELAIGFNEVYRKARKLQIESIAREEAINKVRSMTMEELFREIKLRRVDK